MFFKLWIVVNFDLTIQRIRILDDFRCISLPTRQFMTIIVKQKLPAVLGNLLCTSWLSYIVVPKLVNFFTLIGLTAFILKFITYFERENKNVLNLWIAENQNKWEKCTPTVR